MLQPRKQRVEQVGRDRIGRSRLGRLHRDDLVQLDRPVGEEIDRGGRHFDEVWSPRRKRRGVAHAIDRLELLGSRALDGQISPPRHRPGNGEVLFALGEGVNPAIGVGGLVAEELRA